jgi:aldehyde:ferredoxin oxidoreductase
MGMVLTGEDWAVLIGNLMGYDYTEQEFRKTGERLYNLERAFSVREGSTRADDTLPGRLLKDPMPEGPAKGSVVDLDPMLDAYYEYRGWDKATAAPTREKLKELGLEWVIKDIF